MIFSEAVNIAEDLAKAQTEEGHEASTSLTEIPPIVEIPEDSLTSEVVPATNDTTSTPSDPSLEFTDHILTDEVEEIPLPAVTDLEPTILEDTGEESDEEVVPEEEIPDPGITQPPALQEILASEPPSTIATESPHSEGVPEEKEAEPADVSEQTQPISDASELPAKVEVLPMTTDQDEDLGEDEEELTSVLLEPSDLETKDSDEEEEEEEEEEEGGSQPANKPEVEL